MTMDALYIKGVLPYAPGDRPRPMVLDDRLVSQVNRKVQMRLPFAWASSPEAQWDALIRIIDAKTNRRASAEETEAIAWIALRTAARERQWIRVGMVIILGLMISAFGSAFHFVISGPMPFAIGAFGMLLVIIALAYGHRLNKPHFVQHAMSIEDDEDDLEAA
jgi:hypothetical protein